MIGVAQPAARRVRRLVVGGGTAGSVLAARLSEDLARSVCLLEAGPDYGPLDTGHWPEDVLDASALSTSHNWPPAEDDDRTLGGRMLGGSSACNACVVVRGTEADYDEWGGGWSSAALTPFLDRAEETLRTAPANTDEPAPFHLRFLEAAEAHDRRRRRTTVSRERLERRALERRAGVPRAGAQPREPHDRRRHHRRPRRPRRNARNRRDDPDGRSLHAETIVLAAGAYFSPAILMRAASARSLSCACWGSPCLRASRRRTVARPPRDERRLGGKRAPPGRDSRPCTGQRALRGHVYARAASRAAVPAGSFDLHLLSWVARTDTRPLCCCRSRLPHA